MDPIKIVVTNSDSTSVTSSTSYEQSQSATELNKTDRSQNAAIVAAAAGGAAAASAASLPSSLSSTPTPQQHHQHLHQLNNNGTKIKSINKRRNELPPLKLSTYEPKANTFHLQVDNDHDVDDECRKLLLNPLVNKPSFPSSQSTTSLNKRVTISPKSAFSRFEPSQSTGKQNVFCLSLFPSNMSEGKGNGTSSCETIFRAK